MPPCAATRSVVAELVADELVLERDAPTRGEVGGLLAEVRNRAPRESVHDLKLNHPFCASGA
jgi:hypothetical protein